VSDTLYFVVDETCFSSSQVCIALLSWCKFNL